jgi:hypothetical protein
MVLFLLFDLRRHDRLSLGFLALRLLMLLGLVHFHVPLALLGCVLGCLGLRDLLVVKLVDLTANWAGAILLDGLVVLGCLLFGVHVAMGPVPTFMVMSEPLSLYFVAVISLLSHSSSYRW